MGGRKEVGGKLKHSESKGLSGGTGRRRRLKISRRSPGVWVRFPPQAPLDSPATRARSWQARTTGRASRVVWPPRFTHSMIPAPPIEPMLAKLVDSIPAGDRFLFEPKWDGFRAIVFRGTDDVY